ncbi:MAG: thermonuclease family protein, partial [Rhodocyclaceae bacterium]|nr:thermonuclease family protein [Rhodocyclaceae bacterium]
MHGVQTERIRLFGIDAPEKSQPYGSRAKAELARLCLGRTAQIAVRDHDRHGRIVAQVFCGGQDAALHLLQRGLAWVYVQYRPPAQYLQACLLYT